MALSLPGRPRPTLVIATLVAASFFADAATSFNNSGGVRTAPAMIMSRVPATDPTRVAWRGRYRQNLDGSASFDWAGVQARVRVSGATSVYAELCLPPPMVVSFRVLVNDVDQTPLIVANSSTPAPGEGLLLVGGLDPKSVYEVAVYHVLEPFVSRGGPSDTPVSPPNDLSPAPTLLAFSTDGVFVGPTPMRPIKLFTLGDSITSGFGAGGVGPCAPGIATNDHSRTYTRYLCDHFAAECVGSIAWAGKGIVANSPSSGSHGQLMGSYVTATLGGEAYARDWDHNRPSRPDGVLINLGTNDMGAGGERARNATFVAEFVAAYVELARNITRRFFSGYPTLFLGTGPITSAYDAPVLAVIATLQLEYNITAWHVNYTGAALDGCDGHPGAQGHRNMNASAAAVISRALGWRAGEGALQRPGDNNSTTHRAHSAITHRAHSAIARGRDPAVEWVASARPAHPPFSRASTPLDVTLTVRADGSGMFTSVQAALDSCAPSVAGPAGTLGHVTLLLRGVFRERVRISKDFPRGVSVIGDAMDALKALIVFNVSGEAASTFNTHTVLVAAADTRFENVSIANDAYEYDAALAAQSVALHLDPTADRFSCIGCVLLGGQDTLYVGAAGYGLRAFFLNSFLNGSCDSIFGGASTVFERSHLDVTGALTAPRGDPDSVMLFLNSTLSTPGEALLSRPWGEISGVVFANTFLSPGISPRGWDDWGHACDASPPGSPTWCSPLYYAEGGSTGPGAVHTQRPWWTHALSPAETAQWTRNRVLRGWDPFAPLPAQYN